MLVRSLIYGWGFDFMRPFQKETTDFDRNLSFLFGLRAAKRHFAPRVI